MKKLASSLVAITLCMTTSTWAADKNVHSETTIDSNADGTYSGTSKYEGTDSTGAKVHSTIKEENSNTLTGKQKSHAKVETSRDPKGLGNKTWAKGETTATVDAKGNLKRETTASSVDAAGTGRESKETAKTTVKSDGSAETKVSKKIVTDPKGLMNKHTEELQETTQHAANGSDTKIVKKEIDGKVVEQTVR